MPWLRIDDNEAEHPKVIGLIELAGYEAYYRLHKLRGYCARLRTGGHFTRAAAKEIGVKPRMLAAMIQVGLVDDLDGDLSVHDWDDYNPSDATAAERMRRHRRNANRNGAVTEGVTDTVTDSSRDRNGYGSSRAAARARPVPQPQPEVQELVEGDSTVAVNPAREASNGTATGENIFDPKSGDDLERKRALRDLDRLMAEAGPKGIP